MKRFLRALAGGSQAFVLILGAVLVITLLKFVADFGPLYARLVIGAIMLFGLLVGGAYFLDK